MPSEYILEFDSSPNGIVTVVDKRGNKFRLKFDKSEEAGFKIQKIGKDEWPDRISVTPQYSNEIIVS